MRTHYYRILSVALFKVVASFVHLPCERAYIALCRLSLTSWGKEFKMQYLEDYYHEQMTSSPQRGEESKPYKQISPKYSSQRASRASARKMMGDYKKNSADVAFNSKKPSMRRVNQRNQTGSEYYDFIESFRGNEWVIENYSSSSSVGAASGSSRSGRLAPPNSPRFNVESHKDFFSRNSGPSPWHSHGFYAMSTSHRRDRSQYENMKRQGMVNLDAQVMYRDHINGRNWSNMGRMNNLGYQNREDSWTSMAIKPLSRSVSPQRPRSSSPKLSFKADSTQSGHQNDPNMSYGRI